MKYIIDTDIAIEYLKGNPHIVEKFSHLSKDQISISAITKAELLIGPKNLIGKKAKKAIKIVHNFIEFINVIPFDSECADIFADISFALKKKGKTIGGADIIIAATALKTKSTLVTHNQKHFSRINSLPCIDWFY